MKVIYTIILMSLSFSSFKKNDQKGVPGYIHTVNGKVAIEQLNFSLTHEHIMSNFGAGQAYQSSYNNDSLFSQVIPYLKRIKSQGVYSIFDCTAAYFGRDVKILKAFSDSTGMQIITNTGFYGAFNDRYVPKFAFESGEKEIAQLWIAEFENGIDQTGIKPGFIKLGFDEGAPSEIDIKLFKAGLLTHLQSGLTLVVHTGNNAQAAKEQLKLLEENGVSPAAWIWAHANKMDNPDLLVEAAGKGAWISLDGVNDLNVAEYVSKIEAFRAKKLLHKVLLSHDGNSFPRGGKIRKYESVQTALIPALKNIGYSTTEIDQLMVKNPQVAFAIKIRKAK